MGNLDLNLIKEFSRRPGLYDRNNPYYKDRTYVIQSWNEISQKLGFEIRLLKERMLQLRNRYNLEKRRIDGIKAKYPNRIVRSQWPLYMHMNFMNGHIKHRRVFNKMTTHPYRAMSAERDLQSPPTVQIHSYPGKNDNDQSAPPQKTLSNGELDINDEEPSSVLNTDHFIDEDTEGPKDSLKHNYSTRSETELGEVKFNNVENLKSSDVPFNSYGHQMPYTTSHILDPKERRRVLRLQKYESFGKFLAMSLNEMSEIKAMRLIEKFTSELVKTSLDVDEVIVFQRNGNPVIHNVETYSLNKVEQSESPEKKMDEQSNDGDEASIPTTSNAISNNYETGDDYEDEENDHIVYDLTEDEPLSA